MLTGAGISAESGLKTFRDSDGLWEGYRVEEVATPEAWRKDPALVLDFYNTRRKQVREAQPNAAHFSLAQLEEACEVIIITQNIDDLHERAGSTQVIHLHGEILKKRSSADPLLVQYEEGDMMPGEQAPDGSPWRPDVVWFGEPVPRMEDAVLLTAGADLFAVIGSSLVVYPAASLLQYAPAAAPKFILDKKIPGLLPVDHLHTMEAPATEAVPRLAEILRDDFLKHSFNSQPS